jgi:hypothetical protein
VIHKSFEGDQRLASGQVQAWWRQYRDAREHPSSMGQLRKSATARLARRVEGKVRAIWEVKSRWRENQEARVRAREVSMGSLASASLLDATFDCLRKQGAANWSGVRGDR